MKLSADEVASEEGQDFSVKVPGYGAHCGAEHDGKEQKGLKETTPFRLVPAAVKPLCC